jgi:DNA-binding Xre family transcriptional regulator
MSITEAVAIRLSSILKQRGILKKDFREYPGVKGQSICNIFRSKSTPSISMTTLYRICRALDMSMAEFLTDPVFDQVQVSDAVSAI